MLVSQKSIDEARNDRIANEEAWARRENNKKIEEEFLRVVAPFLVRTHQGPALFKVFMLSFDISLQGQNNNYEEWDSDKDDYRYC